MNLFPLLSALILLILKVTLKTPANRSSSAIFVLVPSNQHTLTLGSGDRPSVCVFHKEQKKNNEEERITVRDSTEGSRTEKGARTPPRSRTTKM
ncbi:hypothetical protein BCV70DRAFT_197996 [Testicularia cyperi]|uniref:Secreted protein n=1 Tax=Testicularia cyperi TaxID=1882483 RepID=A0A317XZU2_9BASI|nr:hypothetical protein BCV70DRAFT_197996 [Testicularia cyperi]